MAITFNKREKEKKKQKKRKEKLARKEQRKSEGTQSFEDMIVYVDENGMFCDTPPDLSQKEELDPETINVSTPQSVKEEPKPLEGRVQRFNYDKGYGFIVDLDSKQSYFFHVSNAPEDIDEGHIVTFELERGDRGLAAVRIQKK